MKPGKIALIFGILVAAFFLIPRIGRGMVQPMPTNTGGGTSTGDKWRNTVGNITNGVVTVVESGKELISLFQGLRGGTKVPDSQSNPYGISPGLGI